MAGEASDLQIGKLPEGWTLARLGDMISLRGGLSYKGEFLSDSGNSLVTMGCVSASEKFKKSGLKRYIGDFSDRHRLCVGDMVIATRDVTQNRELLGSPALIPEGLPGEAIIAATNLYMVSNHSESPTEFFYWLMKTPAYRNQIVASAKGTTIVMLTKDSVENFTFPLPPLAEQKAITAILGALDDKIELNRRMNKTLEGIAKALFQSWFVDFDPVRAKLDGRQPSGMDAETAALFPAEFQDSLLGPIPKGWNDAVLNDLVDSVIGGDWGGSDPTGDENVACYCIRGADIPSLQEGGVGKMPTRFLKPASVEKRRLLNGDLAVEISGGSPTQSTGRPVLISDILLNSLGQPLVASNFCRIVKLKTSLYSKYIYYWLRYLYDAGEFYQFENGTTGIKNLAFTLFSEKYLLALPDLKIAKAFDAAITSVYTCLQANTQQSHTLAALRDTLLPKLLSGELRVEAAKRELSEATWKDSLHIPRNGSREVVA